MTVHVTYKYDKETGSWYVDSDLSGYFVVAPTLVELRRLVHEGLPFFLEGEEYDLVETGGETYSVPVRINSSARILYRTSLPSTTSNPDVASVG